MSEHVRTLESQAVIRHIAGTLSTFPPFSGEHPSWCIPIAENIYNAYIAQLERERQQAENAAENWKETAQQIQAWLREAEKERDEDRAAIRDYIEAARSVCPTFDAKASASTRWTARFAGLGQTHATAIKRAVARILK